MKIICTGKIANTTAGHVDHALAYAAGWQRLGHEVTLIEQVGRSRCVDEQGRRVPFQQWHGRQDFEAVARRYGLWPRCSLIYGQGEFSHGLTFAQARQAASDADLLITRSGQIHKLAAIFEPPRRRAYFDGNPGSTQTLWHQQDESSDPLGDYDYHFTLGLNIGAPDCPIPTNGLRWRPMPRPVILPMWPVAQGSPGSRFTTISTWKGRATMNWRGVASGEKFDNWLRFLSLPSACLQAFEISLRFESDDLGEDRSIFEGQGWSLADPRELRDLDDYRRYIAGSCAEFSVAHNRYVAFNTGWFSDRSALYLACGRPVLVQSTGIESHLPVGEGLLTFRTLDEAVAGVEAINADYATHSRAARDLAIRYFDSDKVLTDILEQIGD